METLSLTLEQALDALKINAFDRPYFIDQLTDYDNENSLYDAVL